jgi:hypothetical protein
MNATTGVLMLHRALVETMVLTSKLACALVHQRVFLIASLVAQANFRLPFWFEFRHVFLLT